jgi:hypothetical protein
MYAQEEDEEAQGEGRGVCGISYVPLQILGCQLCMLSSSNQTKLRNN